MVSTEKGKLSHFSWLCREEKLLKALLLEHSGLAVAAFVAEMERTGYTPVPEQVHTEERLKEALINQDWDVIVVNAELPELNLFRAIQVIMARRRSIPIIVVTTRVDETLASQIMRAGANDYLQKDNLSQLSLVIEREIQQRRMRNATLKKSPNFKLTPEVRELITSALTHELKSPVRVECQLLQLLQQGRFGAMNTAQEGLIEGLILSKNKMHHLIENILWMFTAEEYEDIQETEETTDVNQLIRRELLTNIFPLIQAKSLILNMDLDENLQAVTVDALSVYLVLNNFVQNAVTYTESGGMITIRTKLVDGELTVSVRDTGVGIAPKYLDALFKELSPTKSRYGTGAGLGLYLSKKIVDSMGGTIGVDTQLGKGSLFYFTVPVA